MAITQAQIDEMLDGLQGLLARLKTLREQVAGVEDELTETRRDYDLKLGTVNAEAERLETLKLSLEARLKSQEPAPPPLIAPVNPPQPVLNVRPGEQAIIPPPLPAKSQRRERKLALLDYIYYFTESDQLGFVDQINAVLDDERRDVGDILEALAWGDIWKAKADWETLDDHHRRLAGWKSALEERDAYWQQRLKQQSYDPRYGLWQKKKTMSREAWLAFLDVLAKQEERDNEYRLKMVAELEQRWEAKQAEPGTKNE